MNNIGFSTSSLPLSQLEVLIGWWWDWRDHFHNLYKDHLICNPSINMTTNQQKNRYVSCALCIFIFLLSWHYLDSLSFCKFMVNIIRSWDYLVSICHFEGYEMLKSGRKNFIYSVTMKVKMTVSRCDAFFVIFFSHWIPCRIKIYKTIVWKFI